MTVTGTKLGTSRDQAISLVPGSPSALADDGEGNRVNQTVAGTNWNQDGNHFHVKRRSSHSKLGAGVRARPNDAYRDGYEDASSWCEDVEPTANEAAIDAITAPCRGERNKWLLSYQAGWCAGVEAWMEARS